MWPVPTPSPTILTPLTSDSSSCRPRRPPYHPRWPLTVPIGPLTVSSPSSARTRVVLNPTDSTCVPRWDVSVTRAPPQV
eukprot:3772493-Pyramimonas_sp.AAC.1